MNDEELLKKDLETWENQSIEFMSTSTSDHELGKEIAGFATANIGRIYIGVNPDKMITGVDGVGDGFGKDRYQRRVARITTDVVKPRIRVKVSFIQTQFGTVVRIDVPKGEEPVYYVDYRPYIRDLSTTRKLEPLELKNLYRQDFLASLPSPSNERIDFLTNTLLQLTDVQLIFSDYRDHLIRPDIDQMQYDLGATGRKIRDLGTKQIAVEMGVAKELEDLGTKLEDLEVFEFYIDGGKSVDEFGTRLQDCAMLAGRLYEQTKKNLGFSIMPYFQRSVVESAASLRNEWANASRYVNRGQVNRLREAFRRFGYTFYRLGSLPDADKYGDLAVKLRDIGEKLRNLSSTEKYFLEVIGWSPIEHVQKSMEQVMKSLDDSERLLISWPSRTLGR